MYTTRHTYTIQRRQIDVVDTAKPSAIPLISPERLQTLRHLEDKIVCKASRCLHSTYALIQALTAINAALSGKDPSLITASQSVQQELQLFEDRIRAHLNAIGILGERVQATLGLVSESQSIA
jgi:hypothetical protein